MPPAAKSGVFISYSREDGALAADLRRRLATEGVHLWRDRENMEGGRDWWLQITAALDAVEFMLLLMTPAAARSPLVRREWRHARQRGVCIYPIKASPELDFDAMPRWMRSVHFYDLDAEWPKLLNDLRTRCERRRVPFMVDELPPEFIARHVELDRLIGHLLDRERQEPIATVAAVRAGGGYGKTVLARAVCHDGDIQNAFDDGILWVTLGERPDDLTGRVEDLIYLLAGERPGFNGIDAAVARFVEVLADRDILLIIDDVWEAAHLKPFLQGGARCARLITTRVVDVIPTGAARIDLGPMQPSEAVALLGFGVAAPASDLAALASRLGEWPLLLRLVNAALRDRIDAGQSVAAALAYVRKALDRKGLTVFDAQNAEARHAAVAKTIELSVERLTPAERQRFAELVIFPEDVEVPLAAVERLWGRTGGLDDFDTEQLCDRLHRLSLLLAFDPTLRHIKVHDIIRQLLLSQAEQHIARLHADFLDACRPAGGSWANLAHTDAYLWDHLAHHLVGAERHHELDGAVRDLRYLAAKTFVRTALAAERDLSAAQTYAAGDATLARLKRQFIQCSHLLNRGRSMEAVAVTLHSRLQHVVELAPLTRAFRATLPAPRLEAVRPFPDSPHDALVRTMSVPHALWGCAITPDVSQVVAAAQDGRLVVWGVSGGAELGTLAGHTGWVRRCAISPDGTVIVSAAYDRRLRIWDTATRTSRLVLKGHIEGLTDCAISRDGRLIASSSHDDTVRVWDLHTGELIRTLAAAWDERSGWVKRASTTGHLATVWGCALNPDGTVLASASADESIRLWHVDTGEEFLTLLGHGAVVRDCVFSPDGQLLASGGEDDCVRVWDARSGIERLVLRGHTAAVQRCAFTPDGTSILSASADRTVRLWDSTTGEPQATYVAHTELVTDCAVSANGAFAVSSSVDGTVRVWDLSTRASVPDRRTHREAVNGCSTNHNGTTFISASDDTTLNVWNAATGQVTAVLEGHTGAVRSCATWRHSGRVLSASTDRTLRVWDSDGAWIATLGGHRGTVNGCAVSPDGRTIGSVSQDRTLRLWDGDNYQERLRIVAHGDSVNACTFTTDGRFIVSASLDSTLKLWNLAAALDMRDYAAQHPRMNAADWERALGPTVLDGHSGSVNHCAVAPDGSFLVSASSDRTLIVWNASSGQRLATLVGHADDVNACAISPDSRLVVSVSDDGTLRLWDARTFNCISILHVDGFLSDCAWVPGSDRVVAVGAAGVYELSVIVAEALAPII